MWARPAAMLLCVTLLACGADPYTRVSLEPETIPNPGRGDAPSPIIVGMAPILSAASSAEGLMLLCTVFERQLGRPVKPFLGSSYQEINSMVMLGQLDVALICTGAYADTAMGRQSKILLVPRLTQNSNYYHSVIVVSARSPFRRFEDLRATTVAFTDPLSLTGYAYPVSRALALGDRPNDFFKEVRFTHSHDLSLEMVALGLVQSAAVDSAVADSWMNSHRDKAQRICIIEESADYPAPPIVVPATLPEAEARLLRTAFARLADSPEGREVLDAMHWKGFADPDPAYIKGMEAVRALLETQREETRSSP